MLQKQLLFTNIFVTYLIFILFQVGSISTAPLYLRTLCTYIYVCVSIHQDDALVCQVISDKTIRTSNKHISNIRHSLYLYIGHSIPTNRTGSVPIYRTLYPQIRQALYLYIGHWSKLWNFNTHSSVRQILCHCIFHGHPSFMSLCPCKLCHSLSPSSLVL